MNEPLEELRCLNFCCCKRLDCLMTFVVAGYQSRRKLLMWGEERKRRKKRRSRTKNNKRMKGARREGEGQVTRVSSSPKGCQEEVEVDKQEGGGQVVW